jgi:hypothetical protein
MKRNELQKMSPRIPEEEGRFKNEPAVIGGIKKLTAYLCPRWGVQKHFSCPARSATRTSGGSF